MEGFWLFVVTVGPLLLLGAIIYGVMQYRNRRRDLDAVSDQGARDLRRTLEREENGAR